MFILIKYELKKSNYNRVKELKDSFSMICTNLCKEKKNRRVFKRYRTTK